jgi:uncharacterized membrane protein YGL010W
MKSAADYLSEYAAYHRDRRNIAIHGIGIPLIVFALAVLSARPMTLGTIHVEAGALLLAALAIFYVWLDLGLGLAFGIVAIAFYRVAEVIAAGPVAVWLGAGLGIFALGWILQFIGHAWEGRKPAFLDDVMGLAIGPLFVTAEAFFALGRKRALKETIEARVGPSRIRTRTAKA